MQKVAGKACGDGCRVLKCGEKSLDKPGELKTKRAFGLQLRNPDESG